MKARCILTPLLVILCGCQKPGVLPSREFSKIIFLSNRNAPKRQFDIFMMDADGNNQTNLTQSLQDINSLSRPLLAPRRRQILFLVFDEKKTLRILNLDNHRISDVTIVDFDVPQASFSPKGDKIIFVRKMEDRRQIFVVDTDGREERHLSNMQFDEFDPVFSSDGSKIAFVSRRGGFFSLNIMNANGEERKTIAQNRGKIRFPAFSPDDELIAYHGYENNSAGIYLVQCNGRRKQTVVQGEVVDSAPLFTPDANRIIFLSSKRGIKYSDICLIGKDGKNFRNLTCDLNYINKSPKITPDGKSIVFESVQFNNCDIYSVGIDGENLINLSNHPKWDQSPSL